MSFVIAVTGEREPLSGRGLAAANLSRAFVTLTTYPCLRFTPGCGRFPRGAFPLDWCGG
jgi:hypothetical protein